MTKSKLKNSGSSGAQGKTDTNPEETKLDEDGKVEKEMERTDVIASDDEKNYMCDKCFSIWSDEVLDILFRGTDTVTVNSKITYGAVVRFFEWAKAHLGKYAHEAVETLLFRADIGDNLKFLQMENFDEELEMLLKEGEITCCNVFLLIYQPHEMVSKIMPENTCRISLRHHIYSFESKQSTESSPSPASHESPCKETSPAEVSPPPKKEVMGSDDSESDGVDTESTPVPDVPESASVTDDPESTFVTDVPESTSVTDAPESTSATDVPESTSLADALQSTLVTDVQESTPTADVPQNTPVADVSESTPVADVTESTPVRDTDGPKSTVNDTDFPKSTPVKDTDVSKSTPVNDTDVPKSTPVKNTNVPEDAPVSDVLEGTSVTDLPESTPVTGDLQTSPGKLPRIENKEAPPILSPRVKNKPGESTKSKDNKVKDSGEGKELKRDSSCITSKDIKVMDNTDGQDRKSSSSPKMVSKPPSSSTLGKESQEEEGMKDKTSRNNSSAKLEVKEKDSALSSDIQSSVKSEVKGKECVMKSDTSEELSSPPTCGKEIMLETSSSENKSSVHKDDKGIQSSRNVEGIETPEGKKNKPQTKTVEKRQQIDKEELQSPRAKRKTRSMSNVDSDGCSSLEGNQRPKRRKVENSCIKELASGIVSLLFPTQKDEVRDDKKLIKDAEKNEKLTTRSTTKVAQSPKDTLLNNRNNEKVPSYKESEISLLTNEKTESHSTYEKPYVTRAGDRMQRRRRSENLQDSTGGEGKYSLLKERVEHSEKTQQNIETIGRERKGDENYVKEYPEEESFMTKRKRFKNLHTPEKNIVQTRRKSRGSTGPVVSKEIAALLSGAEDSDSMYELPSDIDDDIPEMDKVSSREPAVKKTETKQKDDKLIYTKALDSIKEFDGNYVQKLSFKDIGDLVVNVSTIDFSQFDGPQSTRRGITKEWLKNPIPKTVAVSNGMIIELFEYLFKRMTVIKVLSVMFWILKKLDSKLQTSNAKQVKDAVALVVKEFEVMEEDMFVVYKLMPFKSTNVRYITQTSIDMKNTKRVPYLTFANGEMLFLHNHLVLNPTNPDPLRFYHIIRSIMDLRKTVLLVPDSQTLVQIGESVRKEFYAQRLAGTEQEFVCKEWDCKKLFRTGKPAPFQTKVKVRDILAHFMKWKNAAKENDGVVNSAMDLNHSIEGLFDKSIELRGMIISSRFDKIGFCFQLYAKYCDIVFLQRNLKSGLEFLESYTGLDEILFFQSRRKLKSQCHAEHLCPGKSEDVWNGENINVSHLKSQISTLSNELTVHNDATKHSENKMREYVKNISHLKKGVRSEQSQLISEIAEISVTLQGKKERRKTPLSKDSKKRGKKSGASSRVCSAIKDLVANDVPVDEIRHIIEVIMENIVGKEPCNVPDDDWIHKYVKELDTSCEMD